MGLFLRTQVLYVHCFVKLLNSFPALGENQNSLVKENKSKASRRQVSAPVLQELRVESGSLSDRILLTEIPPLKS